MKQTTIYVTRDYKKFCNSDENRGLSKPALKKMTDSMKKFGWLPAYPMHVVSRNGRLVVIDGQHRFAAAQSLNLPCLYVVCAENEKLQVSDINVAQKPWNNIDFANSYHNQGDMNYTKLINFVEKYKLPLGISAKLLMAINGSKSTGTDVIREGKFKVKCEERAEIIAEVVVRLKGLVSWAAHSSFVSAIMRCMNVDGFSASRFIQKCEANPGMLMLQPTTEAFVELIEKIYNHRATTDNRLSIRFEALK
jgi:hypothetical protein